ncbi:MAG: hypothetical protein Q7T82_20465 [Armatimonadota bacterium]|nr:hypothetical protein [Armatimonadota bacterium]
MRNKLARLSAALALALSLIVAATSVYSAPRFGSRSGAGGRHSSSAVRRSDRLGNRPTYNRPPGRHDGTRHRDGRSYRHNYPRHRHHRSFHFGFGYPYRYYGFGLYPYDYWGSQRLEKPERPAWVAPAPVKLTDNTTAQWVDPIALSVTLTGDTTGVDRLEVGVMDANKSLLKHRYAMSPYVVKVDIPSQAAFLRIRTLDADRMVLSEAITPVPAR